MTKHQKYQLSVEEIKGLSEVNKTMYPHNKNQISLIKLTTKTFQWLIKAIIIPIRFNHSIITIKTMFSNLITSKTTAKNSLVTNLATGDKEIPVYLITTKQSKNHRGKWFKIHLLNLIVMNHLRINLNNKITFPL